MAKQERKPLDSVGWLFWFIVFAVALIPSVYFAFQIVNEDQAPPIPVGMGVILAGFIAGIVAWVVNAVLHLRAKRFHETARKKSKKR
ncbi:MAG: hypothetical protein AMXMBFR82_05970 [Candidatus Hydrogenedentota bacterium]